MESQAELSVTAAILTGILSRSEPSAVDKIKKYDLLFNYFSLY